MTAYTERSTFHTGKKHKSGAAYSVNHNGLEKGRQLQEHINPEKFHENIYHYYCVKSGEMITAKGGEGGVDFKKFEKEYYKSVFKEGLDIQNERYKKDGHSERCKTLTQFMNSKPPMEIMTELGNVKSEIPLDQRGEILQAAVIATFKKLQKEFGNNMQVLNHAFHADEGMIDNSKISYSNHMHTRLAFFVDGKDQARDKHGKPLYNENKDPVMCKVFNQTAALEEMGFGIPKYKKGMTLEQMTEVVRNPENWGHWARTTELYRMVQENPEMLKHTKICTSLVAFSDFSREYFNKQLEHQAKRLGIDLTIEREAKSKSYRKLVKEGKVDLSRDVISDLDKVDYMQPHEYKAKQEEERATAAREAADREAERQQELIEQNQEFEKSLGSKEKAIKIADAKIKQRKEEIRSLDSQAESSTERRNLALQEEAQANDRTRAAAAREAAAKAKADQEEQRRQTNAREADREGLRLQRNAAAADAYGKENIKQKTGLFGKKEEKETFTGDRKVYQAMTGAHTIAKQILDSPVYLPEEAKDLERETFLLRQERNSYQKKNEQFEERVEREVERRIQEGIDEFERSYNASAQPTMWAVQNELGRQKTRNKSDIKNAENAIESIMRALNTRDLDLAMSETLKGAIRELTRITGDDTALKQLEQAHEEKIEYDLNRDHEKREEQNLDEQEWD